jgi:hypothetical protein
MATYTALHIQSGNLAEVQRRLVEWLKLEHNGGDVHVEASNYPDEVYGETFINDEMNARSPTVLAVGLTQPDWVTVHYNCFHEMRRAATELSAGLSSTVIVVLAQSVSDAYYFGVYQSGYLLRVLCFADGAWETREGTPLPFEKETSGQRVGGDEAPVSEFGREEVIEYCAHFGLRLWEEADDTNEWIILRVRT